MLLKTEGLSLEQKVWEFDFWVTPSIVDIRSTDRFQTEMKRIVEVLEALSKGGHQEIDKARFAAEIVERSFAHMKGFEPSPDLLNLLNFTEGFLVAFSALLFLVTGKSDNNNKCQFPIYLKNQLGWRTIPTVQSKKTKLYVTEEVIPRVLDSESYMSRVARMHVAERQENSDLSLTGVAQSLLFHFTNSLLVDEASRNQLAAFLHYYCKSKEANEDATILITPLVMFQVRGSVAASGGHEPEELLRKRMTDWGMIKEIDFNEVDVVLDVEAGKIIEPQVDKKEAKKERAKTRAYDFVLPFRTPSWHPRIFIQSQFYAGDSGSVSHKNVDQTSTSRQNATRLAKKAWPESPTPIFLEYVDGAGYSASLNGDLKNLLSLADTAGFFQVRTASVRLRRELQKIGFLTPLEVGHAVLRRKGDKVGVIDLLKLEGYTDEEIQRTTNVCLGRGFVLSNDTQLVIPDTFLPAVRRHLLLDIIACEGKDYLSLEGLAGIALVPGYGPFHGLTLSELETHVQSTFNYVWPTGFMKDLQELCDGGFVVLR